MSDFGGWQQIEKGPPDPEWAPRDDGTPYAEVVTFHRDVVPDLSAEVDPPTQVARVSGDGRATAGFCLEVSQSDGALPSFETVQSALDHLCMKGALMCIWLVAGMGKVPTVWKVRQVGTIGGTPAAVRYDLTAAPHPNGNSSRRGPQRMT